MRLADELFTMPLPQQTLNLENLPKAHMCETHVWVDYLELVCLVNLDRQQSKADILDRVRTTAQDQLEGKEIDDDIDAEDVSAYEPGEDANTPAKENDKWATLASDWYSHLSYRSRVLGEFYPFTVSDEGDVLSVKDKIAPEAKLYIFLLLASNLSYCKSAKHALTKSFELLSAEALKSCFQASAEVHVFGTSAQAGGRYTGNLWSKINKLANDLGEQVIYNTSPFPAKDTGDNGLDIVAWVPLGDDNSHRFVVFGQCACTPEWVSKQHSSSNNRWKQIITLGAGTINMVFIPFCLRKADGTWHSPTDICCILVDRIRFIHLLRDKAALLEKQKAYCIVERAITQKENPI